MSNTHPNDISQTVMERIKREHVSPTSRKWFVCVNCTMQFAWFIAVVFGAVSVAILLYTGVHGWFGFYEATERSRVGLAIAYIPVLWIVVLLGMVLIAYQNMRLTGRGYRYPVWVVLGTSLLASIAIGFAFYIAGLGQIIDMKLGQQMPMYSSVYKQQELFWQTPVENRWLGTITAKDGMMFSDIAGNEWQLDTSLLEEEERELLMKGDRVRVLGIGNDTGTIMACGVFPWKEHLFMLPKDLELDRDNLIYRLDAVKKASSSCSRMGVFERMP